MSSRLLSATFHWPAAAHTIETAGLPCELSAWDADGKLRFEERGTGDVITLPEVSEPLLILADTEYDERQHPYRPHLYGWLDGRLYYALNAALGGMPARLGQSQSLREEYEIAPAAMSWSVWLANPSRRATARTVVTMGGREHVVDLAPRAHGVVAVPDGVALVTTRSTFRVVSYVYATASSGHRHVFDHLFPVRP